MESEENAKHFASQPQSDGTTDKTLHSQVLEYYKKYSQNRELPKYFSGTNSTFEIGDWHETAHSTVAVNTDEGTGSNWMRPPLIGQDRLSEVPVINVVSATSPTSSVASNRKLEWDNGADIGYSNVEFHKVLHKSISLPVLTNLEYGELRNNILRLSPEGNIEVESKHVNSGNLGTKPSYSSSTSESNKSSKKYYISSSSSSVGPQQNYSSDSDVQKPLAESTPIGTGQGNYKGSVDVIDVNILLEETSKLGEKLSNSCENLSSLKSNLKSKQWHSQVDLNMVDQVSHYKNLKILKLSTSKPVVVECVGNSHALVGENKLIQTSLPRNVSIAVQTDLDFSEGFKLSARLKKDPTERQGVIYICHSDSDKERNTNNSSTQTNSGALSNCNSFEYLYGGDYNKNVKGEGDKDETTVLLSNLRRCPPKSDLTTLTPSDSSCTSKESPLAELISSKPSQHLMNDLQKNLQLLQKVIKSTKYDSITKKHCLKKLVQKLVDSHYADDSSSFDSSEKSEVNKYIKNISEKASLHDNKPWIPVQQAPSPPKKEKRLETETFVNEIKSNINYQNTPPSFVPYQEQNRNFVPIHIIHKEEPRRKRNPLFTLTDNGIRNVSPTSKHDRGDSTENELYEVIQSDSVMISSSDSSGLKHDNKSWREDKTRSEQLLEQKTVDTSEENKDHLLNFAKKEREHQLSWINNEITHLSKLKKLLERKATPSDIQPKLLQTILEKPRIEDIKPSSKKSTSVYIVTTEKSSSSNRSDPNKKPTGSKPKILCKCDIAPCRCKPEPSNIIISQNDGINLQNARLVSSEKFTTNGDDNQRTSIRRYTFEVPLDNDNESRSGSEKIQCLYKNNQASPQLEPARSPKRDRLSCELVVTEELNEPTSCKYVGESKTTQTTNSVDTLQTSSSESSEASTPQLCICCKKSSETMRRRRLEKNSEKQSFCIPCYNQNKINPYCTYPGYVCMCYNSSQTDTIQKIRETIEELESLEAEEELCKKEQPGLCAKCKCNLKKPDKKPKGGMAYVLTLQPDTREKWKPNKNKYDEIKIKATSPNEQTDRLSNAYSEVCRCTEDSTKDNSESYNSLKKEKRKQRKPRAPTLQEYLHNNNPSFVSAAEDRRKCLLELAYMREKRCQKYKQLLALTNGAAKKNNAAGAPTAKTHLFSPKEIKRINSKHYVKLPEVQQKLCSNKDQQIKKANKLLADIFNQRLRQQVLKGNLSIPQDASIINLA